MKRLVVTQVQIDLLLNKEAAPVKHPSRLQSKKFCSEREREKTRAGAFVTSETRFFALFVVFLRRAAAEAASLSSATFTGAKLCSSRVSSC